MGFGPEKGVARYCVLNGKAPNPSIVCVWVRVCGECVCVAAVSASLGAAVSVVNDNLTSTSLRKRVFMNSNYVQIYSNFIL